MPDQQEPLDQRKGAVTVARLGFVLGILVSVAANVQHSRVVVVPEPVKDARRIALSQGLPMPTWNPGVGPLLMAAFWPIALLLAVEIMTRVRWRPGFWFAAARFGGVGVVAAGAAVLSYRHMQGLLAFWGEDSLNSHIGPLVVDGLMVVGGFALLSMSYTAAKTTAVAEVTGQVTAVSMAPHGQLTGQDGVTGQAPAVGHPGLTGQPEEPAPGLAPVAAEGALVDGQHLVLTRPAGQPASHPTVVGGDWQVPTGQDCVPTSATNGQPRPAGSPGTALPAPVAQAADDQAADLVPATPAGSHPSAAEVDVVTGQDEVTGQSAVTDRPAVTPAHAGATAGATQDEVTAELPRPATVRTLSPTSAERRSSGASSTPMLGADALARLVHPTVEEAFTSARPPMERIPGDGPLEPGEPPTPSDEWILAAARRVIDAWAELGDWPTAEGLRRISGWGNSGTGTGTGQEIGRSRARRLMAVLEEEYGDQVRESQPYRRDRDLEMRTILGFAPGLRAVPKD